MDATSTNTVSEMFISTRRPNKNRNRLNGNTDHIVGNGSDATTPISIKPKTEPAKVPVLYYLTRNGHLEHPHLIDVPLSPHGLYLRDVINTLNHHRGKGMANMYSWSFKRSYKSGYVWHDLSEDDLIEATNGHDYVLKGSELLEPHDLQTPPPPASPTAGDNCSSTAATATAMRQRNQSWSSFDNPQEYVVVKCESSRELAARFAADAGTQTEEEQRRRRRRSFDGGRKEEMPSPPPSNSSSEEVVSEGAKEVVDRTVEVRDGDPTAEDEGSGSGRMKASQIVMQLISCGAPSRLKMQKE